MDLSDLYLSPYIQVIKSRRMKWVGHVARMGDRRVHIGFWWGNLRERDHLLTRHRWEDNINIDLQEVGWRGHVLQ